MKAHIPAATIVGVVPAKQIEQGTGGHGQNITGAIRKQLNPGTVGAYADHATPTNLQFSAIAAGGFHKAKISGGNIDPSIHPEVEPVGGVVSGAFLKIEGYVIDQSAVFL